MVNEVDRKYKGEGMLEQIDEGPRTGYRVSSFISVG